MDKRRVYWDTSIFLCFLNRDELDRSKICEDILQHAAMDELLIVTSTYTIVEVIRPKKRSIPSSKPLTADQIAKIKGMFRWPFIQTIELDDRTALYASDLARDYGMLPADSVHAASAILWKAESFTRGIAISVLSQTLSRSKNQNTFLNNSDSKGLNEAGSALRLMISRKPMKPAPAPKVSGNTEAERMDNAVRRMFSVSKEELSKREAKWKRAQARKKRAKKVA